MRHVKEWLRAAFKGEDWIELTIANGVNPSTARTWVAKGSTALKGRDVSEGKENKKKIILHRWSKA